MRLSGQGRRVSMGARTRGAPWSDLAFRKGIRDSRGPGLGARLGLALPPSPFSTWAMPMLPASRWQLQSAVGPSRAGRGARAARFSVQWRGSLLLPEQKERSVQRCGDRRRGS